MLNAEQVQKAVAALLKFVSAAPSQQKQLLLYVDHPPYLMRICVPPL